MKYITGEYYQEGISTTSLMVQHVECIDKKTELLLGCVCTGVEADYVTEQLSEWFYREGMKHRISYDERRKKQLRQRLNKRLREIREECVPTMESGMTGILCLGNEMELFGYGKQKIYLCNRCFERPHIRCIADSDRLGEDCFWQHAQGETGIALLLATAPFYEYLTEEMLKECLAAKELNTAEGMERRLRELGSAAAERGARNMGAMILGKDEAQ